MTVTLVLVLAELLVGGGVVCAEARGEDREEQIAIARVIKNRLQASGRTALDEMLAPWQFAKPCRASLVKLDHLTAYATGRWGEAPDWSHEATHFCSRKTVRKVRRRWRRRGLRIIESGRRVGHRFWKPRG